ncbi:MAG TPA: hypothetical protein VEI97_04235 [bacterium]|nr:hypothetical protein [bacterium]
MNHYYLYNELKERRGAPVANYLPGQQAGEEGTFVNVAGVGIMATTDKPEEAERFLRPASQGTLATRVWTGASQGLYAQAAPAVLLLLAVTVALRWPLYREGSGRRALAASGMAPG